jgi:acyl dehydratase
MEGPSRTETLAELQARVGTELGASEWMRIEQSAIDTFAQLTGDTYFIHIDPERAARETPFGGSIAHGFFTMSLLSNMAYQVCPNVAGTKTGLNYGFNRLRFVSPVPVNSRVRGRFVLKALDTPEGRWQATWGVTIEIEGAAKPAIVAEWVTAGLL